jgi:hypothetical protein
MRTNRTVAGAPELGDNFPDTKPIPRSALQLDPNLRELAFWEEGNPKSVINVVPDRLREMMRKLPPELLGMSDREFRKHYEAPWTVEQLRIAFWDEFWITTDNNAKMMRAAAVYSKVCSKDTFYTYTNNPVALAYIVRPPRDYVLSMRSLLDIGMERFYEILNLPLEGPNGKIDTRLIGEIVKIVSLVDNRVKGAVAQKIMVDQTTKTLSVNVNKNYEMPKSEAEIKRELIEIEKEIRQLKPPETALDAPQAEPAMMDSIFSENPVPVIEVKGTPVEEEMELEPEGDPVGNSEF